MYGSGSSAWSLPYCRAVKLERLVAFFLITPLVGPQYCSTHKGDVAVSGRQARPKRFRIACHDEQYHALIHQASEATGAYKNADAVATGDKQLSDAQQQYDAHQEVLLELVERLQLVQQHLQVGKRNGIKPT